MPVELVQVTTADGVRLDGALAVPAAGVAGPAPLDLAICVHGTGSNFYGSTLFDALAEMFLALGIAVLRINTRGHDGVNTISMAGKAVRLGAAYELVDDCRHDLAAWTAWARQQGYAAPALVGHSMGALKSIYALAHAACEGVARLIAISPPRLSHALFAAGADGPQFVEQYAAARARVEAGRERELLDVRFPLPYLVTARGFVDKYGPDERYDLLRWLPRVSVPAQFLYGGAELASHVAFRGVPDQIEAIAARMSDPSRWTVGVVPEADHFYSGARGELVARVRRWLLRG